MRQERRREGRREGRRGGEERGGEKGSSLIANSESQMCMYDVTDSYQWTHTLYSMFRATDSHLRHSLTVGKHCSKTL